MAEHPKPKQLDVPQDGVQPGEEFEVAVVIRQRVPTGTGGVNNNYVYLRATDKLVILSAGTGGDTGSLDAYRKVYIDSGTSQTIRLKSEDDATGSITLEAFQVSNDDTTPVTPSTASGNIVIVSQDHLGIRRLKPDVPLDVRPIPITAASAARTVENGKETFECTVRILKLTYSGQDRAQEAIFSDPALQNLNITTPQWVLAIVDPANEAHYVPVIRSMWNGIPIEIPYSWPCPIFFSDRREATLILRPKDETDQPEITLYVAQRDADIVGHREQAPVRVTIPLVKFQ